MKLYQQVPIQECGESLLPIPIYQFAAEQPHPYVRLGAPYGERSPYYLRQGVLERLLQAQHFLQIEYPNWRIQIFDAYRPIAVQQFMVDYTLAQTVQARGLHLWDLTETQRQEFLEEVYEFWAVPNLNPAMPPPHSTGAAIDVTLVDGEGAIAMGSPIDEMSPRSYPDYFRDSLSNRTFHHNRQILKQAMIKAEFRQHPKEWWHYSHGDQLWAWLGNQASESPLIAQYGRAEDFF
ncbi:MAG: D-alanyl-D-alanine dipeptidase [Timaviella obliquedivisa GSE-PSE-MK23-08B]|jgi:D-alanyl-D-alanine dipeptidase|nr:D-alanyl-D-alanine dipeptidase [Timaviella obliquedivisa GSE-PSE-MK23-08B]